MVGWHPQYNGHGFGWTPRSWWWTGRPGVLQFMRSQSVGCDWATELNWTELRVIYKYSEPYPVSCFADTEAPSPSRRRRLCEERMITQWPDKSCDISYSTPHNSENCPQEVGTNSETRDQLYSKQPRGCSSDHHITDTEMAIRADYTILLPPSMHTTLKLPYKSFCSLSSNQELVCRHKSTFCPGCWPPK